MSDDDLPPPRARPGAPGFVWLLFGAVLVLGFVVILRVLHPSQIGVGPRPAPLQSAPVKP